MPYLERSEVDHAIDVWVRFENLVQCARLGDIDIVEARTLAADELDAIDRLSRGVAQIVSDYDLIIGF